MKFISLMVLLNIIFINNVFAHGEDKYGPNKGYIRMPGIFHTELVPSQEDSYSIYLIDVNNKNPVTKDSSIELMYKNKNISSSFTCDPADDHFKCRPNKKINNKKGQLIIKAIRSGKKGNNAIYDLPLMLKGENQEMPAGHDMSKMKN